VQEVTCILKVPCATLRDNTERPETAGVGSNTFAGTDSERIFGGGGQMLNSKNNWRNPFGDGRAGEIIVNIVRGH